MICSSSLSLLRQTVGEARNACRVNMLPRKKTFCRRIVTAQTGLKHSYYLTSEKGLYRAGPEGISFILDIPLYGLAMRGARVFMGLQLGKTAILAAGNRDALENPGPLSLKIIACQPIPTSNHRIHQITNGPSGIWVASTARNTLLRVDPQTERIVEEIAPFFDDFGEPILYDHNHINSVMDYGSVVIFTAYKAGGRSMIGVCEGDKVAGYFHEHPGGHDIYLTRKGFLFCDTFGSGRDDAGGIPVTQDGFFAESLFRSSPGYIVRGAAENDDEFLIGHSHKGSRARRFSGKGALLVFDGENFRGKIEAPCAQIYQIVGEDGSMPAPTAAPPPEQVHAMLRQRFGPPEYESRIRKLDVSGFHKVRDRSC